MFRPVRVSLIAQSLTWAHDDPLYLVPGFVIQDQIPSPGPLVAFSYRHSPRLANPEPENHCPVGADVPTIINATNYPGTAQLPDPAITDQGARDDLGPYNLGQRQ